MKLSHTAILGIALGILPASTTSAASLTHNGWGWLHSQNNGLGGGENLAHDISVVAGSAGYAGSDAVGAATSGTFGDGTVEGYAFFQGGQGVDPGFNDGDEVLVTYASGGTSITGAMTGSLQNNDGAADVWVTTAPVGFTTTADYTSNTVALGLVGTWFGSIDISSYSSGTIYFLYGSYRNSVSAQDLDLTMTDTDGPELDIELLNAGSTDGVNNWEHYIVEVGFVNDTGYDSIDYLATFPNGRITGIVLDGVAIPEPSAALLGGLGLLALLRRRR